VTGQRGFDADTRGFTVSHFADENDIGIGTQKRAQRNSEIKTYPWLDLYLLKAALSKIWLLVSDCFAIASLHRAILLWSLTLSSLPIFGSRPKVS
jgi:hypothetical protein